MSLTRHSRCVFPYIWCQWNRMLFHLTSGVSQFLGDVKRNHHNGVIRPSLILRTVGWARRGYSSVPDSPDSGLGSPVTRHRCMMAFSYALRTALRTLGFLFSCSLARSSPESTPSGSSLLRGNHCLQHSNGKTTWETMSTTQLQALEVLSSWLNVIERFASDKIVHKIHFEPVRFLLWIFLKRISWDVFPNSFQKKNPSSQRHSVRLTRNLTRIWKFLARQVKIERPLSSVVGDALWRSWQTTWYHTYLPSCTDHTTWNNTLCTYVKQGRGNVQILTRKKWH